MHDLTDEMPVAVQIAVPTRDRPPGISQPPTEVFRFDGSTFEVGLSSVEAAKGEHVRVYDPARTVVDLMRSRHRLGSRSPTANLRRRDARPASLLRLAADVSQWIDVLHGYAVRATVLSMSSLLPSLPATFTTATARARGVHPRELYRWRDDGEVIPLSRGVFRRVDAPPASYPDLLAVAYRAPRAIVCCVSAAVVHDLTDEIPVAVQIAVPTRDRPPQISQPATEVFRFDASTFELGLSQPATGTHLSGPIR